MTSEVLPFQNKLSGNYSKKVSFKNSSMVGYNQYVRKLGRGFSCTEVEYSLKYVGLTSVELAEVETLFGYHAIDSFISWQAPIDEAAFNYSKPKSWSKEDYLEVVSPLGAAKEPKTNLSFSMKSFTKGIIRVVTVPAYEIIPDVTSVSEGGTVIFTVTTSNVPDGTTLYYTVLDSTTSGVSDVSPVSGSIVVLSGSVTFNISILTDVLTEATEVFQVQLRTDSTSGTVVATSTSVSIIDVPVSYNPCDEVGGGKIVMWSDNAGLVIAPASTEIVADKLTAISYCAALTEGGFTDWRLPTLAEAQSFYFVTTCASITNTYYGTSDVNPVSPSTTWRGHNPITSASTYSNYLTPLYIRAVRTI